MAPVIFTVTQSQRGERTAAGSQYPAHRHGHPPPLPFHPQVSLISRIQLIREPVKKSVENFKKITMIAPLTTLRCRPGQPSSAGVWSLAVILL